MLTPFTFLTFIEKKLSDSLGCRTLSNLTDVIGTVISLCYIKQALRLYFFFMLNSAGLEILNAHKYKIYQELQHFRPR